ncbi:MAG: hypothetical protein WC820_08335 [Spirochaetales bacterium]|jgi:hypothetical protein
MKYRMRAVPLALFILLTAGAACAQDLAFSIGTWSFLPDAAGKLPGGTPGVFPSFGATYGITRYLEAGVAIIPRLTPKPFDDIFVEEHVGVSLFGERVKASGGPAVYINTLLDAGFIFGAHNVISGAPVYSRALFLRITPITLGNPYYGRRDRMLSVGLVYDYDANSTSLFVSLIAADFYLAPRQKAR